MITAVITTFRRPELLRRALHSAQKQTFSDLKILICDGALDSQTKQIVEETAQKDPRIRYCCAPNRLSSIENYQFGIDQVSTPFFSILSDDDLLLPSFYETALRSFERFPAAQFFLGSTLDISTQGRLISAAAQHWPDKEFYSPEEGVLLTIAHYFNWTGAVYRKEAVQKHRLDPRVEAIDYDWILRLSALYPFTFSKKPCASFVHHEGSYSNQCGLKLLWPSFSYSSQTLHKLIAPTHHPDLQKTLLATLHRKLFRMFVLTSVKKNWAELQKVCEIAAHQGLFMHRTFPCLAWTLQQVPFFHALCMKFLSLYRFCKRSHLQWSLKRFT